MATFGQTNILTGFTNIEDKVCGRKATCPSSGVAESIYVYIGDQW
ncbi:unnamed protein product, partial [marine sediment metagenome]